MKSLFFLMFTLHGIASAAIEKDSTIYYPLPDSVKAMQYLAEVNISSVTGKKEMFAGIKTDVVKLSLEADKNERSIVFEFARSAPVVASGLNTDTHEKGEIEWKYNWSTGETYQLLISTASDSAANFSLYSGYIFLPKENKWKLIGTCKISGRWTSLQNPAVFYTNSNKANITIKQVWVQRQNGSWKNLKNEKLPAPVINFYGHIDSLAQHQKDIQLIEEAIHSAKTGAKNNEQGVYFTILKEGNGRQVTVSDTVTVFYKGYLFANDSIFDQTGEQPATFPLKRLIKGWQIGVPLCKVGGKIKLVIPSDLGYSIRTRAAKIPPNSILVFEVEVVDAKSPRQ